MKPLQQAIIMYTATCCGGRPGGMHCPFPGLLHLQFLIAYSMQNTCKPDSTVNFRLLAPSKLGMQNCKVSRDLNPPIESKLSHDNLDSSGGFKPRDTFAVFHSEFFGQPT